MKQFLLVVGLALPAAFAQAQDQVCADGKRAYFGVCPDGNKARPAPQAPRPFQIVGLNGKCLDVGNSNAADGTPIALWDCHGSENQSWRWVGNHLVGIGGKCLVTKDASDKDGTPVILWTCNGGANENWSARNGALTGLGGKCLDIPNGNTGNGTQVILYACHGSENQRWELK